MHKNYPIYIISLITILSCNPNNVPSPNNGYDRSLILENITNNIIIPSYNQFSNTLNHLKISCDDFTSNPSSYLLSELRQRWIETYISFQNIEIFNIGKAEEIYFNNRMNTYPCNTTIINNNINNMMYDFTADNFSNYTSQGLPALDYLLYGIGGDSSLILDYYTGAEGDKYCDYLSILVTEMVVNTEQVVDYWASNSAGFISSSGNTSSSSLNMITNDFIYYYEKGIRSNKIGIPAGVYSNNSLPNNVEAFYKSDISRDLAIHALDACKRFFVGESFINGNHGYSLNSYLEEIDIGYSLNDTILSSFENSRNKLLDLNSNLTYQITSNNIKMLECFDALQQGVVLLKTDMLSNLNINIDYVDADGD